ncbi:hypothetical protein PENSPDRAFT_649751 [Peniophora sp. CONT]|nr:hypothetical protein PENSPDRAFT_649751 [Peniophora sp. CONT]
MPVITPYTPPTPFRPPGEAVPSADELEALQKHLEDLRQQSLDRARKAGDDLRTIDEAMRKLKEKEKGKAKAAEKVKRERGFSPMSIDSETPRSSLPLANDLKPRPTMPIPAASKVALDSRKTKSHHDVKNVKKKKRKRDEDEDDDDSDAPLKIMKPTPPPPPPTQPAVPKVNKPPIGFIPPPINKPSDGPTYTLPSTEPLLPSRPQPQPTPVAGPSHVSDVMDDFSKAKPPNQVAINTFYASVEPYTRPIREEDIGYLEWSGDEVEPYIMPKLGDHYTVQWEQEDIELFGHVLPSTQQMIQTASWGRNPPVPPKPRWDPATLADENLDDEDLGHGPLTERLVSALLPNDDGNWKSVKAAEEAMGGRHGVGVGNAGTRQVIVEDLERRIRDSLRYHGILDEKPDFTDTIDDPIATALRHAQEELREVSATNKARKARLVNIAKDRLGYQEYLELRDTLDQNIMALYHRLQRKDSPRNAKKKSHKKGAAAAAAAEEKLATSAQALGMWPCALGLGPNEENELIVAKELQGMMDTRRQWIENVGAIFEEKEADQPERIYGLPERSVYEGIEEEVASLLARKEEPRYNGIGNGKGKARAGPNEMDIG